MKNVVTMTYCRDGYTWQELRGPYVLCNGVLRDYVHLPTADKIDKLYAVFTKRPTPDSFEICSGGWGGMGKLKDIRTAYFIRAEAIMGAKLRQGYKYVRLEYTEK